MIAPMSHACTVYFARPDALQGTLVETLKDGRPTMFLGVPRVWEKFEDRLKAVGAASPAIMQKISGWAKSQGTANVQAIMNKESPPWMFSIANFLILSRIK